MVQARISADEVAAAADALMAEGQSATIRAVRDRLGGGSPNTIQRHLAAWRSMRQTLATPPMALPSSLMAAIGQELERVAAQARAEIEERLVLAQKEAAELATAGEAIESERDALEARIADLTHANDTLAGRVQQLEADLDIQAQRAEREQKAAEAARIELAKSRLQIESCIERSSEQSAEVKRLRDSLSTSESARTAAEQQAAVSTARLEEAQKHFTSQAEAWAEARKTIAQETHRQTERLDRLQAERDEAREAAARLGGQLDGLRQPGVEPTGKESASSRGTDRPPQRKARE